MIEFNTECAFSLDDPAFAKAWIEMIIVSEGKSVGELNYIFCDDEYLLNLNQQFLNHDTLTDIISFDYTQGDVVSGDIYISIERVKENASDFGVLMSTELERVMAHGILHYCGYKDKTKEEKSEMRDKEDATLTLIAKLRAS